MKINKINKLYLRFIDITLIVFVAEYYTNIHYTDLKTIYCMWFFLNLNSKFNDVLSKKYVDTLVIKNKV